MDKKAKTEYPILDAIATRWSPRAFDERGVTREKLQQVLEAASWAASAFNEQPWRFIIATKDSSEEYEKVLSCLGEFNQVWAKSAPVLMIVVTATKFSRNDNPNRSAEYDAGQAVATMAIQAAALDLYMHQMAGFDPEKSSEIFDIPADYKPMVAVALGYLGDPAQLSEQLREREDAQRERKALGEFVFTGTWGSVSSAVSE